jgi:hypothetical protein
MAIREKQGTIPGNGPAGSRVHRKKAAANPVLKLSEQLSASIYIGKKKTKKAFLFMPESGIINRFGMLDFSMV